MTEKQGGVPLPPGEVHIFYDPSSAPSDGIQQPQAQQAAVFDAKPNDDCPNGSTLDANMHFVVYAVKNGLIRVLHRNSTNRSLLRGHEGKPVTDISFFQNADVLGTVGGNVIVWRVFERANEIVAEKLLEIPDTLSSVSRLVWHPFNPNQFWLIHRNRRGINVATLVETTRIKTVAHPTEPHAVCRLHSEDVVMQGATQVAGANLTDLCWSQRGTRHVLTTHDDGSIKLWDIKAEGAQATSEGVVPAVCIATIMENEPVTRCLFLPHENVATNYGVSPESTITPVFCTATKGNSCLTIWSPFTEGQPPTKLQIFQMDGANPNYNIGMAWGPSFSQAEEPGAFFFLLSDRTKGKMYALSLKSIRGSYEPRTALVEGFEYLVPFSTKYPTYSWSLTVVPAESLDENSPVGGLNYDIKFYALQSKMVQDMKIPHYMLLPPTSLWEADTQGVRMEPLTRPSNNGIMDDQVYEEEEYELDDEDEDDDDEDYGGAPDPSSLPTPDGLGTPSAGGNPFANWLGNLASKAPVAPTPEPLTSLSPMPPPVPPSTPATGVMTNTGPPPGLLSAVTLPGTTTRQGSGLLSPMEILSSSSTDTASQQASQKKKSKSPRRQRGRSPRPKGKDKKNSFPAGPAPSGKIVILKRDDNQPPPTAPVATPSIEAAAATAASTTIPSNLEETLKKAIGAHFKAQEKVIAAEVQRAVRAEIKQTVLPELSKSVNMTVEQSVVRPLQSSMERFATKAPAVKTDKIVEAVTSGVEAPLKEAFTESMRSMMIPAFEAATREMFSQVAASLESTAAPSQSTDAMSAKIDALTTMVQTLTAEVSQLRNVVGLTQQAPPSKEAQQQGDQMELMRNDILRLIKAQNYEAAFTKALSATTAEMAVFACRSANLSDVLGGNAPVLSQPIILCLMQQLGTGLVSASNKELQITLAWLQEIALTLVPTDESIQRHIPSVLQQLVASINAKMQQGDPALRRPLQMLLQVIRGMQR